jgi:hypothetical protein
MPEQSQQHSDGDSNATDGRSAYCNDASIDSGYGNHDSNEIPPGMQQVLDNHTQIVQMMSQIRASTNNNLP